MERPIDTVPSSVTPVSRSQRLTSMFLCLAGIGLGFQLFDWMHFGAALGILLLICPLAAIATHGAKGAFGLLRMGITGSFMDSRASLHGLQLRLIMFADSCRRDRGTFSRQIHFEKETDVREAMLLLEKSNDPEVLRSLLGRQHKIAQEKISLAAAQVSEFAIYPIGFSILVGLAALMMYKTNGPEAAEAVLDWALACIFAGVFLSFAVLRPFTKGALHACAVHTSRGRLIQEAVLLIAVEANAFQTFEELTSYLPESERIPWERVQTSLTKGAA